MRCGMPSRNAGRHLDSCTTRMRGCQYASREYRDILERHRVACGMSAALDCYDNAVAESFFAALKKELVHGCAFETRTEACDTISDYIENYYNAKRRHSAVGNLSPSTIYHLPSTIDFELTHVGQLAARTKSINFSEIPQTPSEDQIAR